MKKLLITLSIFLLLPLQALMAQEMQERQRWKFGVSGGTGYLLGNTEESINQLVYQGFKKSDAESLVNQIKWSGIFSTEAYYLFKPIFGMGMKYIYSGASAKKENLLVTPSNSNTISRINIEERCYFLLLAPTVYLQAKLNPRQTLQFNQAISYGFIHFRDESEVGFSRLLTLGNSLGFVYNIGLEYYIRKNWSVGANFSYIHAVFDRVRATDGSETGSYHLNQEMRFDRIDFSIGTHFYISKKQSR